MAIRRLVVVVGILFLLVPVLLLEAEKSGPKPDFVLFLTGDVNGRVEPCG